MAKPLVHVAPGDVIVDNDPRVTYTKCLSVEAVDEKLAGCRDAAGRVVRIKRSRIHPAGSVRRSGFTLRSTGG